jgi:electron transport complex protein RnfA
VSDLVLIFFSACLVNNLVLDQLIGVCPAVALSRRIDVAAATGAATVAVAAVAAPAAALLRSIILEPLGLEHLELILLVTLICCITAPGARVLQRRRPELAPRVQALVPLLLGNCTMLGVALLALEKSHGLAAAASFGLGSGAGFALVLALLFALQDRSAAADVPDAFRGAPIALLTLGLLSMAFLGFTGLTGI